MMQTLEIIDMISFFQGLSDEEKHNVAQMQLRIFKYEAKAVVVKQNSAETHLFIIIKGTATVLDSQAKPLAILKPGEVFGEISFLATNQTRTATVVANNELIVMRVERDGFKGLDAAIREKIKDKLIDIIIQRLTVRQPTLDLSCEWVSV